MYVLMLVLGIEFRFRKVTKVLVVGAVDATAVHVLLVDPQYGTVPNVSEVFELVKHILCRVVYINSDVGRIEVLHGQLLGK